MSTANICKITMFFSELCLWHIWSMYWNFHVIKIIFSPENWILVIFWCNQKSGGNRKILPVTIVKPLHLTIQVCQMVLTFRKSFFDQIWQPQKLWLTIFQAMCFLDCQPQKLNEKQFFFLIQKKCKGIPQPQKFEQYQANFQRNNSILL